MSDRDETRDTDRHLIGAGQVQGTTVYSLAGKQLGSIKDVMIDKASGRIAYAVLSFGGFLGFGDRYHPLPWEKLRYDTELGGYIVDVDPESLEGAPSFTDEAPNPWLDPAFGDAVSGYYRRVAV
ncbi:MAG: PRC-barrel domain-containing protein [Acetobacteraceae bacterium]|nr:PRC-barrel domain-containing protein [Pseudomonadota bacterium]